MTVAQRGPAVAADHPARLALDGALAALAAGRQLTAGDAIAGMAQLRDAAELALRELIAFARVNGATWSEIAELLGVTTQAAHKRYGPRAAPARAPALLRAVSASARRPASG